MAACGLQHLFEKPLPENPTLLESLANWKQIKPRKPMELSTFTEIFGELHFKETPESPRPPSPSSINKTLNARSNNKSLDSLSGARKNHGAGCFASLNSESLQHCTEGLGFESSDEVENTKNEGDGDWPNEEKGRIENSVEYSGSRRNYTDHVTGAASGFKIKRSVGSFPPPISSIGRSGKPCFSLRSYRQDGRFVLTEIKIPNHEILHASREDGRLKLHVAPQEEVEDDDEEEELEAAAAAANEEKEFLDTWNL